MLVADGLPGWVEQQSDHLHGVFRWASDTGQTVFELPDVAEYIESVYDDGTLVDPLLYSLSDDRTQIVFDTAPTAASVIVANYVIARL